MIVKITVSKISRYKTAFVATYATPIDMYVEGSNLEIRANGSLTDVYDKKTKTLYTTDFAYASAITALDAAASVGLQWVLT